MAVTSKIGKNLSTEENVDFGYNLTAFLYYNKVDKNLSTEENVEFEYRKTLCCDSFGKRRRNNVQA